MWTVSVESFLLTERGLQLNVILASETDKFARSIVVPPSSTLAQVKARLRAEVGLLSSGDELLKQLQAGPIDLTPDPPVEEDKAVVDRKAFLQALNLWRSAKGKIDLGLIAADDSDAAAVKDVAVNAYKPEYVGLG